MLCRLQWGKTVGDFFLSFFFTLVLLPFYYLFSVKVLSLEIKHHTKQYFCICSLWDQGVSMILARHSPKYEVQLSPWSWTSFTWVITGTVEDTTICNHKFAAYCTNNSSKNDKNVNVGSAAIIHQLTEIFYVYLHK